MSTTSKFDSEKLDFSACEPPCSPEQIHSQVLDYVRSAQALCGFRLRITSGFRSKAYERSKGRNGSSSHSKTPGLAVDISVVDSHTRYKVILALLYLGVPRLGIGKTFIHLDIDESKPHPSIFHYYD